MTHLLTLTPHNRGKAVQGVQRAPSGWVLELREPRRSDAQNVAIHGLVAQIQKQRPIHNGIRMDVPLWKATFLHALGEEVRFTPTLEGDGVFPLGLRTSQLRKDRFSELIEFILAWCARENITVEHFDDTSSPTAKAPATSKKRAGEAVSA